MKRAKTFRQNLKALGTNRSMTSRDAREVPITPIEPIVSSEEDQYGTYDNDDVFKEESQKQLTSDLRILERQRAIEQFITSEERYCNQLKKVINLYLEPLSKHLSKQDQFILFGDISTIYEKNARFSITLEQKYKAFDPSSTQIGDDILKFIPNLRVLYQNYVNRHEQASKLLASLQTDSKFVKICDGAMIQLKKQRNGLRVHRKDDNKESESIQILRHLLLLPIDRVTKYEDSLKDIVSYTDEAHADYDNLQQCLHDMIKMNQLICDKMREFSEREVVRKIANAIKGNTSFTLETPYRKFIKNGYLIKMGKTKPQRYLFFLFNDLIFYCKKVGEREREKESKSDYKKMIIKEDRDSGGSRSPTHSRSSDELSINIGSQTPNATVLGQTSSVAHDYSDTSDLHQITALFGDTRSGTRGRNRKSRTKLFTETVSDNDDDAAEEILSMTSFGMNVDIHNEIDVYNNKDIGQFKVHNAMPIDMVFDAKDMRIYPQRYDNKAFEIRSCVKSFIVVAESERAKKEWMSLLEHCTNSLLQLSLTNKQSTTLASGSSTPVVSSGGIHSERSKMKRFAATLYLPKNFTEQCMKCNKQFGYSRKKNHCHHCGWLICSKCLTEKLPSFDSIKGAPNYEKSKSNTTYKVCTDCYSKNKHLFPEFEEASVLNKNTKSAIFAYKQKAKRKKYTKKIKTKNKKGKKNKNNKFIKMFKQNKNNLSEDVENDFYERGSLKDAGANKKKQNGSTVYDEDAIDESRDADDDETEEDLADEYSNSDIEPSMHSIPEHDDRIDIIIYAEYEGSVSSHLAPHWTPHTSAAGHHNRDYSHNLNETGYADNDNDSDDDNNDSLSGSNSDSDADGIKPEVTPPPVSDGDVALSPYYEDTPLLYSGAFDIADGSPNGGSPNNAASAMRLRATNSLNMADVLDELEREQEERREEEQVDDVDDDEEDGDPIDRQHELQDQEAEEDSLAIENNHKNDPRHSTSLLRAIPEWNDTDEETSANDVDAETAYEHLRNLSTHIEDYYEYRDITPPIDDNEDNNNNNNNNNDNNETTNSLKIVVQRNQQKDVPGSTPPVSPRLYTKIKMNNVHKRRLSDKLDKFLSDRPNPPQLIQKQILYTTPEEDIDSLKEKMQSKREEKERVKKRLKRKLSHEFRPSEQEVEERGIKIVPQFIILSSEEDVDEEIIVYDDASRNSFSLQKRKTFEANIRANTPTKSTAYYLEKERQINVQKVEHALIERPTPSDIIQTGYISAQKINEYIPPKDIKEQIERLRAEYKLQMMDKERYLAETQVLADRKERRFQILSFYDNYTFNDDNNDLNAYDIDIDYQDVNNNKNTIAKIKQEDQSLEKEWMRNLRKRKFEIYRNRRKSKDLQMKREEIASQLNELTNQIEIVVNTKAIDSMINEINRLEKERCSFITKTHKQMDHLRNIIKDLIKNTNTVIAVS